MSIITSVICYLRNRFWLTVICCQYITGWRSVMKWVFQELEARVIYSLTTDRQPIIFWRQITCKHGSVTFLTHKKQRKGKCILQMLPLSCHYMKRNSAKNFDCNRGIYMYSVNFLCEKVTLHSVNFLCEKVTLHCLRSWNLKFTSPNKSK